jgi:glycosyltransferase involved in cell wall biosynthesis
MSDTSGLIASVIMPCYNSTRFIGEAIGSALSQSRPAEEVIVSGHESTDDSLPVLASFGERIQIIERAHSGVLTTRNAGVALARGDIVACLDADHVWDRTSSRCRR